MFYFPETVRLDDYITGNSIPELCHCKCSAILHRFRVRRWKISCRPTWNL